MATAGTKLGKPAGPKPQHLPVSLSLVCVHIITRVQETRALSY